MELVLEFFRTATAGKTAIICTTIVIVLGLFLVWAARTQETIKLGPPEISAPESERMKACQTIQAGLHDEIQTLRMRERLLTRLLITTKMPLMRRHGLGWTL